MKSEITSGDTLDFTDTTPDYPASAGWAMTLKLVPRTTGTVRTVTSVASGDDHRITASAATTAGWTAGEYSFVKYMGKGTERYTLESGSLTVLPDPGVVSTLDNRSHVRKTVEALEAWIENRDPAVAEYEIAGRRMKYVPLTDLLKMLNNYRMQLSAEVNAERLKNGEGVGRKIQFRV